MAQDRVQMPASTAGLTRYFDDYHSKIEFKPGQVIVLAIVIMVLTILLHIYGTQLLTP
ncbi:preprotein translocase subunit Sec61beta [Candidatus Woesearchaeota archaeon]|nr:preprotein translocase subunit Sec61beta [Candidatus Woesearchaeota archaeon]